MEKYLQRFFFHLLLAIQMVDGQTCPPPLLHEADLIALMEKHGIGVPGVVSEAIVCFRGSKYVFV